MAAEGERDSPCVYPPGVPVILVVVLEAFDFSGKWCDKMWDTVRDQESASGLRLWHRGWDIAASLPAIAFLGLFLALPHPVQAAVFHCGAGDTVCLSNAIDVANANGHKNTIRLAAGSYTLLAPNNDANGPNGLPSITSTLRIEGVSADSTSLVRGSGAPPFRLIHVGPGGKLTIDGVTLTGGSANNGGALFNDGGVVKIAGSVVSGNSTGGGGGGLFNDGGVVNIAGSLVGGNRAFTGGGLVNNDGAVAISWSSFANNIAAEVGGLDTRGPHSTVRISDSRFSSNGGSHLSGALNASGGSVSITRSTFDHNSADGDGAIGVGADDPVTLIVADSAFTENATTVLGTSTGIGIYRNGLAVVTNTTFARNFPGGFFGGFAALENAGTLILVNSTVADNRGVNGGGLFSVASATTSTILVNTILAGNTSGSSSQDCRGPVTSVGHNLIGTLVGCEITLQPSDLTGDPGLDAFTDNGVPGNGHFPLLPSSPAVDAGDDDVCPRTDQIGEKRKRRCDIGAIGFDVKKHKKGGDDAPQFLGQDSAVSRTDGSDIVGDLIQAVTALNSPPIARDEDSRQLKSLLDLVGSLLASVAPIAPELAP